MADVKTRHAAADDGDWAGARLITVEEGDFSACLAIRLAVFVDEQKVPLAEERDEYDETARHFLARVDGVAAGTARVLAVPHGMKVTRVAVLKAYRGRGVGEALMRRIEAAVPAARWVLDAQVTALPFYERLGFTAVGEVFFEAGIAHRRMVKDGRELEAPKA